MKSKLKLEFLIIYILVVLQLDGTYIAKKGTLIIMFHSMLATYAILVPTLYGNRGQDYMGFGNTVWLAESFTILDSVQQKV